MKADLTDPSCFEAIASEKADMITLCGVVAHSVLTRESSLALIKNCHSQLNDGGYMCVASHTPGYFTRREYESLGFKVHNQVVPMSVSNEPWEKAALSGNWETRIEPFYILQKLS